MSQIYTEVYGEGPALVMIHGWAMHSGVWRDFARQLARHCQVICVDLPGHGRSEAIEPFTLQQIGNALLKAIPVQKFTVLGWSLGATVAMDMAQRFPQRVQRLIVLAGNPHFVRKPDWPGVKAETLDNFAELLKVDVSQTLIRFLALQVNGLAHGKTLLQTLKSAILECPPPGVDVLQSGLDILRTSDLREFLLRNRLPVHLIVGDKDALIPLASAQTLQRLNPAIDVQVLASAGHAPFLSHAEPLIAAIRKLL